METTTVREGVGTREVGPRVLFVDDSPDERELFPLRFRNRFSRFVITASAEAALEELAAGQTELVFTDIALPDESGLELVRRMRAMAPEVGGIVPAVAVTGLGAADDLDRAYRAGFSGYLVKPYDNAELISVVDRVSPSIASLRRVRERLRAGISRQHDVRERLFARRETLLEQREKHALKYGVAADPLAARLECVLSAARSFAEGHFDRRVDELEISVSRTLEDGKSSWVVIAVCERDLLFVEVLDGPGVDFVARRLDT